MLNLEIKKYTDDMQENGMSSCNISRAMELFYKQEIF